MLEYLFEVLGLNYDTIFDAYNSFFTNQVISKTLIGFKTLAIVLFVMSIYTNMISKMGFIWNVDNETILPYSPGKFITSLIFVLLIAFYDKLLLLLDGIFLNLDGIFPSTTPLGLTINQPEIGEEIPFSWEQAIINMSNFFVSISSGNSSLILTSALHGLAKVVDGMIFGIFLIERFFMLGLLKMLGPFAIAISIYKSGSEMFMKWLKLYVATFLLIIPFFLVIGFTNEIATIISNKISSIPVLEVIIGKAMETALLLFLMWVKIKLFKKSYDMVYKVIT